MMDMDTSPAPDDEARRRKPAAGQPPSCVCTALPCCFDCPRDDCKLLARGARLASR